MRAALLCTLLVAGCGGVKDPCASQGGACVTLDVLGDDVGTIDTLTLTASGATTGTRTSMGKPSTLPIKVALDWTAGITGTVHLDVEGLLGTQLRGVGSTDVTVAANMHTSATVTLHAPAAQSDMGDMGIPDGGGVVDLTAQDATPECVPSCENATTLRSCGDAGVVTCTLGCNVDHCAVFVPTMPVTRVDLDLQGLDTFMSASPHALIFDTDNGSITIQGMPGTFRDANDAPTNLQIKSGIGFHVAAGVGIFIMSSIDIPVSTTVLVMGTNAGAFVTTGDMRIDGVIDARPFSGATFCDPNVNAAGPGGSLGGAAGWAGTLPSAKNGAGAGGGGFGGASQSGSSPTGGGGGGGHGDVGGLGGGGQAVAGKQGASYDGSPFGSQGGSGGGGAGKGASAANQSTGPWGGGGGGALHMVAGGQLSIGTAASAGGINVGGCGGAASGFGSGGGSGGSILIEAPQMMLGAQGVLAANGGSGGGSSTAGVPGSFNDIAAIGGDGTGGNGGAGSSCQGAAAATGEVGGGGGAAGRVRINQLGSSSPPAGFIVSPDLTTACSSLGTITTQ